MSSGTVESTNRISIFWLKQEGYIPTDKGWSSRSIHWTNSLGENVGSINYQITIDSADPYGEVGSMRLNYTHTRYDTDESFAMDYKISIVATPCNYGGRRLWFRCILTRNSIYCGKRVGVLYKASRWFGCRECADLIYADQNESKLARGLVSEPDLEKAYAAIGRFRYKGKPTKKYLKYLKMQEQSDRQWTYWMSALAAKIKK